MDFTLNNTLRECLQLMLRPIARFCLRRSLGIQDLVESAKLAMIEVAKEEMLKESPKVNVSRLSVMTGMHRRDVMRIFREGNKKEHTSSFVTRVIGQWQQDGKWTTKSRRPRILGIDGENSEFNRMVRQVSSDVHPGTVLFELERIGAIKRVREGVKLIVRAYVPKGDPKEGFTLLANDAEDLMCSVEENIFSKEKTPNLHAKTEYDNVDPSALPAIRKWLLKEGSAFHQKARSFLSKFDRDISKKKSGGASARVVVGSFSRGLISDKKEEDKE